MTGAYASERHVLLLRHPQTLANREGRFIGRTDSALTPEGEAQVRAMACAAANWRPDIVYTSPRDRALAAARAIAPEGVDVVVLEDLAEIDFGEIEGLTWDEACERGLTPDYSGSAPVAPGGESAGQFSRRVRTAARMIASGPQRSAVVTHGGVMRVLSVEWLGIPIEAAWRISMPHGSALGFELGDGWATLELLQPPDA